jgi:hypothetical protein
MGRLWWQWTSIGFEHFQPFQTGREIINDQADASPATPRLRPDEVDRERIRFKFAQHSNETPRIQIICGLVGKDPNQPASVARCGDGCVGLVDGNSSSQAHINDPAGPEKRPRSNNAARHVLDNVMAG